MSSYLVEPGGALRGELRVPGDKSISHRAVMLAAIAEGETHIGGFLCSEDCLATLAAVRALGVACEGPGAGGELRIVGRGRAALRAPDHSLDLGNSGTSMRLLAGLLAPCPFAVVLDGDSSLRRRPMERIAVPLRRMGAVVETAPGGTAPIRLAGVGSALLAIRWCLPVASAQLKSCLLLAALGADGETLIEEPAPSRDHSERLLARYGRPTRYRDGALAIVGGPLRGDVDLQLPGDISSAMFLLVGASLTPGSELLLRGVGVNPSRTGGLDILRAMGADLGVHAVRDQGGEPVADISVRHAPLHGIRIDPAAVPGSIDEFPALCVAAAAASGVTEFDGASELRHKESDRLRSMALALAALGIEVEERAAGLAIRGGQLGAGRIHSAGDHRVALAFACAAGAARGTICIDDCDNVRTSWPDFAADAAALGLPLTVVS